jgi:hypothetical protein
LRNCHSLLSIYHAGAFSLRIVKPARHITGGLHGLPDRESLGYKSLHVIRRCQERTFRSFLTWSFVIFSIPFPSFADIAPSRAGYEQNACVRLFRRRTCRSLLRSRALCHQVLGTIELREHRMAERVIRTRHLHPVVLHDRVGISESANTPSTFVNYLSRITVTPSQSSGGGLTAYSRHRLSRICDGPSPGLSLILSSNTAAASFHFLPR